MVLSLQGMNKTNDVIISIWIASPAHACIGWVAVTKTVLFKLVYYIVFIMIEEPSLSIDSATISDESSITPDHAVAGNDYDNRIFIISSSDGSDCLRISC